MGAFDFVDFFLEDLGHAFVTRRKFSVNIVHLRFRGFGQQPFTQTCAALARSGSGECAPGQLVKGGKVKGLGRSHGQNALKTQYMPNTASGDAPKKGQTAQALFSPVIGPHSAKWRNHPKTPRLEPEQIRLYIQYQPLNRSDILDGL
jgi:hypothetical protein